MVVILVQMVMMALPVVMAAVMGVLVGRMMVVTAAQEAFQAVAAAVEQFLIMELASVVLAVEGRYVYGLGRS